MLPVDAEGRSRPPTEGFARYRDGAAYLRALGYRYGQGYYFGRPAPAFELVSAPGRGGGA